MKALGIQPSVPSAILYIKRYFLERGSSFEGSTKAEKLGS